MQTRGWFPWAARVALAILCGFGLLAGAETTGPEGGAPTAAGAKASAPQPNPKLQALAPNTGIDLGAFAPENPVGEPENSSSRVTDYSGMVYDMHNHRILLFGGGHSATWTDAVYAFDFKTLEWKALYKPTPTKYYQKDNVDKAFWKAGDKGENYPRPIGRHTYDLLVVPNDQPLMYMLRNGTGPSDVAPGFGYMGGACGVFNLDKHTWEMCDGVDFGGYGGTAEYDPVSKKVIGNLGQTIWLWDPATRKAEKIVDNIQDKYHVTTYSGTLVYSPIDKHMYGIPAKMEPFRLELDRTNFKASKVVKLEPKGDKPAEKESAFAWDAGNQVIGGNVQDGVCWAFDPKAVTWAQQPIAGLDGASMIFHCLVYDPVDQVYVFIGKSKAGKRTFAFKLKPPAAGK